MRGRDLETSFHMILLGMFSVMTVLFDIIIVLSQWELPAIPIITGACALCWVMHFTDTGKPAVRLYLYIIVILGVLMFYALHGIPITDIPILLCLLIVILSRQNDVKLVLLTALSYPIYIAVNIFITGYLNADTPTTVYSRIALGIFCLSFAGGIAVYFILIGRKDGNEKDELRREAADAKNDTKQFLANMSHELRTPINVICGLSELMLDAGLPEKYSDDLYALYSAGKRIQRQISDILIFSELQTDRFRIAESEYEPESVIYDTIRNVFTKSYIGADFAVDLSPAVPRVLIGDAKRLRKILECLLDNAVKFTESGGGYLYVSSRPQGDEINLNIDVYDTGVGIENKYRNRLFSGTFAADDSTERRRGGLGLGLAIVHGIVRSMHGFVKLESSGKGTHVHVTVPQKVADRTCCIGISGAGKYHAVCWFDRSKYARREVGEYYYKTVDHVHEELGVDVTVVTSLAQLRERVEKGGVTHIFIAEAEYGSDPSYFEMIAKQCWVCVFSGGQFTLPADSSVSIIRKPVYLPAVVGFLKRSGPGAQTARMDVETEEELSRLPSGKKALVVDDEPMNIMVAKGMLQRFGLRVFSAASGPEAIGICSSENIDIIFMDHMMPDMNGTDAMRAIRNLSGGYYRHRPIVALTANAMSGARDNFLSMGFDGFLSKPVSMKNMHRVLEQFLREDTDE